MEEKANEFEIPEPTLPRRKKIPKRIDESSETHNYESSKQLYRQNYFETINTIMQCLESRFDTQVKVS